MRPNLALVVIGLMLAACGGEDGPDPTCEEAAMQPDNSFQWIQDNIFTTTCVSSQCHGGAVPEEMLDLRQGTSFGETVDQPSVQVPGMDLIEPGDSANSYLYIKLGGGDQTKRMEGLMPDPNSDETLCAEKLDLIKRWIDAGANN